MQLAIVAVQARLVGDSRLQHTQPQRRGGMRSTSQRRGGGRNHAHSGQTKLFAHLQGETQVTVVHRIEGPAKNADCLHLSQSG